MARFNPIKNSFVAGEISPRLEARDDLDQYFQSCRQLQNFVVLPHGGALERSGTVFVTRTKGVDDPVQFVDFVFSTAVAYVLEFGDGYIRFFTNRGQLVDGGLPVEIAAPYADDEVKDLDWAQEANVVYLVEVNHYVQKLSRIDSTTFTLERVQFRDGKAPLQPANLDTANTVTVSGAGPYTLTWTGGVDLSEPKDLERAVRINDGTNNSWYEITDVTSPLVAEADLKSGTAPTGAQDDWALGLFSRTEGCRTTTFDEGRLVFGGFPFSNNTDRFVMSVSDDFENFEVVDPAATDAGNADKSINRRAVSGRVNDIVWARAAGEQLVIGTTGAEFRAVGENNDVKTPTGLKVSLMTTAGGTIGAPAVTIDNQLIYLQRNRNKLRRIQYSVANDTFSSADISILSEHILQEGGNRMSYQQDPDGVIWQPRDDGQLIGWTIEQNQQIIAAHRHVIGGSFEEGDAVVETVAVIPNPEQTQDQVWMAVRRTINGETVRYVEFIEDQYRPKVTTRSSTEELIEAVAAGRFVDSHLVLDKPVTITNTTQTDPVVVTYAGEQPAENAVIEIREVRGMTDLNGQVYRIVNVTAGTFELTDVDSGATVDGTGFGAYVSGGVFRVGFTIIEGLSHLEAETVQVLLNGAASEDRVVSGGQIDLGEDTGFRAVVGLQLLAFGEVQRFVGGGRIGTDQGQRGRVQRVVPRLHNTVGGSWGVGPSPDLDRLEPTPTTDEEEQRFDSSPPLIVADDRDLPLDVSWTDDRTVFFLQDQPYPMTVLGLMPEVTSHER